MALPSVVLCTGANKGIGLGILEVLASRHPDATYILCSRDASAGHAARKQILEATASAKIEVQQLDVTDDAQIAAAVQAVQAQHGKLDVLINNAGILRPDGWEGMSTRAIFTETLAVNLTSAAVVTEAFLPLLRRSADPKVVGVTSGLGSVANALAGKVPHVASYGASKVGFNGAMMHMHGAEQDRAKAAREKGEAAAEAAVKFYVVQPGVVRTAFTRYTRGKDPREGAEAAVRLALDAENAFPAGAYWEFEEGEMRQVPW